MSRGDIQWRPKLDRRRPTTQPIIQLTEESHVVPGGKEKLSHNKPPVVLSPINRKEPGGQRRWRSLARSVVDTTKQPLVQDKSDLWNHVLFNIRNRHRDVANRQISRTLIHPSQPAVRLLSAFKYCFLCCCIDCLVFVQTEKQNFM